MPQENKNQVKEKPELFNSSLVDQDYLDQFIPNSELYNKNRKTISMRKDLYR
jgi:hypothetical protein